MKKTFVARKKDIKRQWVIVDAQDKVLGRLATRIAIILRGKHKPEYTPHIDCGDGVVVINAEKIKVTGKKMREKEYITYSGYPGGQKRTVLAEVMKKDPRRVIRQAVKRMLSDTPLGRDMFKKLKVYTGAEHPHKAQGPQELKF
ncbi:MAG: 50S ribosomal protein L13 [Candidatus Omnitrophica bacterium]|nr:50S ribosomal protein L13 [Candidatus Omnitrophota bacterium]